VDRDLQMARHAVEQLVNRDSAQLLATVRRPPTDVSVLRASRR
jgi:hypothetical protein